MKTQIKLLSIYEDLENDEELRFIFLSRGAARYLANFMVKSGFYGTVNISLLISKYSSYVINFCTLS